MIYQLLSGQQSRLFPSNWPLASHGAAIFSELI